MKKKVTAKQRANLKPFVKGYDPRRNINGVPKDAIKGREFIRKVGAELIHLKDENGEGDITRFYALVRRLYSSSNPKHTEIVFKAVMPGLLKDEIDVTSNGKKIVVRLVQDHDE